jgi:hypothetical protein
LSCNSWFECCRGITPLPSCLAYVIAVRSCNFIFGVYQSSPRFSCRISQNQQYSESLVRGGQKSSLLADMVLTGHCFDR